MAMEILFALALLPAEALNDVHLRVQFLRVYFLVGYLRTAAPRRGTGLLVMQ